MKDLDISLLINNVGSLLPGDFDKVSLEQHKDMIDVGIIPGTLLTKLLMDKMLKRPKRTGVMFVTSAQVCSPLGGTATYGASKVFLDFMAKALSHENRHNMDVMSFNCGLTTTNFIGGYSGNVFCITA